MLYDVYCEFDIEIDNQEDFKNANWAEYFSVLALAEIAEFQESDISSMHPVETSSRSAEIGEAIAFAKTFIELNNLESRSSRHVLSLKGKKGGIKKNAASNEICAEYIDWFYAKYITEKDESEVKYSGAAKEFYRLRIRPLIEQDYLHPLASQTKKNALRMLESALREHRRSRGDL